MHGSQFRPFFQRKKICRLRPGRCSLASVHGAFKGDPDEQDQDESWLAKSSALLLRALATRLPQPKAFVFLGETASNGKSTIASLLSCLLPAGAVSSIAPAAFSDPARIVNLAGKAANVADELSAAAIAGETFKAAITGNPVEARESLPFCRHLHPSRDPLFYHKHLCPVLMAVWIAVCSAVLSF